MDDAFERYKSSSLYDDSMLSGDIRLLHAYYGANAMTDVYQLEVHSLNEAPKYTALSYAWGPEANYIPLSSCNTIQINGFPVHVLPNL